jgi:hypothetical protein
MPPFLFVHLGLGVGQESREDAEGSITRNYTPRNKCEVHCLLCLKQIVSFFGIEGIAKIH